MKRMNQNIYLVTVMDKINFTPSSSSRPNQHNVKQERAELCQGQDNSTHCQNLLTRTFIPPQIVPHNCAGEESVCAHKHFNHVKQEFVFFTTSNT